MEHEVASKSQAVERYLLGEMAQNERDAFEEHYFTCAECAAEVRSSMAMAGDLKRVLRDLPQHREGASWLSWLKMPALVPACAALFLAAVVGYQNFAVIPQLKAPLPGGLAVILDGQTRGGGPKLSAGEPLHFQMAAGPASGKRVWLELQGPSGQKIEAGEFPVPPEHQPLDVFFPGNFGPGNYTVVIRENSGGKEMARNPFEIVNKENTQ